MSIPVTESDGRPVDTLVQLPPSLVVLNTVDPLAQYMVAGLDSEIEIAFIFPETPKVEIFVQEAALFVVFHILSNPAYKVVGTAGDISNGVINAPDSVIPDTASTNVAPLFVDLRIPP